jgi:hypothetical protein
VAWQARLASPLLARVDAAAGRGDVFAGWETALVYTMYRLRQEGGARSLAEYWLSGSTLHANAGDKWLLKLAEDHDALALTADRTVARATTMRYLLADA